MERMGDPLDRAFTLCCIIITLRASEAAAQCIVIGPVCLFLGVCVCGSVTTITQNCLTKLGM